MCLNFTLKLVSKHRQVKRGFEISLRRNGVFGPPLVACDLEEKHSSEELDLASDHKGAGVILLAVWTGNRQESHCSEFTWAPRV